MERREFLLALGAGAFAPFLSSDVTAAQYPEFLLAQVQSAHRGVMTVQLRAQTDTPAALSQDERQWVVGESRLYLSRDGYRLESDRRGFVLTELCAEGRVLAFAREQRGTRTRVLADGPVREGRGPVRLFRRFFPAPEEDGSITPDLSGQEDVVFRQRHVSIRVSRQDSVATSVEIVGPEGALRRRVVYDDFRVVDGYSVAHQITDQYRRSPSSPPFEVTQKISQISINAALPVGVLERSWV